MGKLWTAFFTITVVCGACSGRLEAVSAAAMTGAGQAVTLLLQIAGVLLFWSGVMEVFRQAGGASAMARLLQPILRPLFGKLAQDHHAMQLVSANLTANLLGLSNAATPIGLQAVAKLHAHSPDPTRPSDGVLAFIALNTTAVQLLPTTVLALRTSMGASQPYAVLPAIWCASVCSVVVVLVACRILRRCFP